MKRVFALALVAIIGYFMFTGFFNDDFSMKMMKLDERVSEKYTTKSVNEKQGEVVFGESQNIEDGSANIVTSIVVNYRSFDTLGEVTVLFISSLGVAFILGGAEKKLRFISRPNFILNTGARLVFGFIVISGVFMFVHGHLTPGGGFPGGSMIAAAFLLLYLGDVDYRAQIRKFKILEGTMGTLYVLLGLAGLLVTDYFLANFIDTGVVGSILSGGIIPIVYVLVGLKVGSELIGVVDHFMTEEVAS